MNYNLFSKYQLSSSLAKVTSVVKTSVLATGVMIGVSTVTPAHAVSFTLDEFTGTDAQVNVTLEDQATDTVRFTLEVDPTNTGNIGDITGLFFNVADDNLIGDFTLTPLRANPGPNDFDFLLDQSGSTTDRNNDVANNVNLNGGGTQRDFELGIQIGNSGGLQGGRDDFQSITFDLTASGFDLNDLISQNFGVRLQSVGPDREGSSKLEGLVSSGGEGGNGDMESTPEPSTILGLSLLGGAFAGLRRQKNN
ncbi:MAG: PEP-CTERM sorting domain-containing protein [Okeania sp. SIO2F4]|uniref:PEP-CTERM sorting domain-containing protein n=1 Tax=Okeania sp. SIO2F4 TaxID=2607790 RepID=UPI00142931FC|nr:PEP-CTERM sorting domain-containing protein [Okeania sp. SIO2F4]NES02482.1 PEP-CTERM sorting domain-containing protein [Okeania sp. SIO2F4]